MADVGFSSHLCGTLAHMDKAEHGRRLKAAIATKGSNRKSVSLAAGVDPRTVTNWTSGATMPSEAERAKLRILFPGYDDPGDPVELAISLSRLTEDRQLDVRAHYKRRLREQDEAEERRGSA